MEITWYGQASFGIRAASDLMIVTDPYDPDKAGYKPFPDAADVVVISSDNDDFHDCAHLVPKREGAEVINTLSVAQGSGSYKSHGVVFRTIEAMEHPKKNAPNPNGMVRFEVDGLSIGHMGDAGANFSDEQVDFFREVDVLLALAGGYPTLDLPELGRIIRETKPKLVIPMHFRTLRYKPRNSFWISEFLHLFSDEEVDFAFSSTATLTKETLPQETRVLVVDYL